MAVAIVPVSRDYWGLDKVSVLLWTLAVLLFVGVEVTAISLLSIAHAPEHEWIIPEYVLLILGILLFGGVSMNVSNTSRIIFINKKEYLMNGSKVESSLSGVLVTGIVLIVTLVMLVIFFAASLVSASNSANMQEKNIQYGHRDLMQVLGNYTNKIMEVSSVPSKYAEDLQALMKTALTARYGEDGNKAVFQFLNEKNGELDPDMYRKVQEVMEAGRNEFQAKQTSFLNTKRQYETDLGYIWTGNLMHFAGYPKIDLSKYDVVTSAESEEAFKTGVAKPILMK